MNIVPGLICTIAAALSQNPQSLPVEKPLNEAAPIGIERSLDESTMTFTAPENGNFTDNNKRADTPAKTPRTTPAVAGQTGSVDIPHRPGAENRSDANMSGTSRTDGSRTNLNRNQTDLNNRHAFQSQTGVNGETGTLQNQNGMINGSTVQNQNGMNRNGTTLNNQNGTTFNSQNGMNRNGTTLNNQNDTNNGTTLNNQNGMNRNGTTLNNQNGLSGQNGTTFNNQNGMNRNGTTLNNQNGINRNGTTLNNQNGMSRNDINNNDMFNNQNGINMSNYNNQSDIGIRTIGAQTADDRYNELKARLDEQFAYMFQLKAELDANQSEQYVKWEEYNCLRQSYERQLKRVIADWVMSQSLEA